MKKNLKKLHLGVILIFLFSTVYIVDGADRPSERPFVPSQKVSFTVTLHSADSSGIQNAKEQEILHMEIERQMKLELTELRKEIIELHQQRAMLDQRYRGLQKRIATLFGNDTLSQDNASGDSILRSYGELSVATHELALRTNRLVLLMDGVLKYGVPQDPKQKERLQKQVDDVRESSHNVALMLQPERREKHEKCQILEVNPSYEIAVINQGYRQGIIPGMTMWIEDGATVAELNVIEVRADIAAVILKQGDWRVIVPGRAVTSGRKKQQK